MYSSIKVLIKHYNIICWYKYSMRDLLFDVKKLCLTRKLARRVTYKVNNVSALSGISSL